MSEAILDQRVAAARHEHLVPGREIHLQQMRGYPFCEVGLITGISEDNAVANIWNTTGACEPTNEQFDALDAGTIARENGALHAWLSPVRQWMSDRLDVRQAGDDKTFGGITGTWVDAAGPSLTANAVQASYEPVYVHRDKAATLSSDSGSEVYVLDAPDGEMFVMQSCIQRSEPALSTADLAHLYRQLGLPDGWGFRAVTLDHDVEVSPNPDNLAHVLEDDLHNVYLGSDVGRAFSGIWPANPPGYAL